jgi:hypothetical protein
MKNRLTQTVNTRRPGSTQKAMLVLLTRRRTAKRSTTKNSRQKRAAIRGLMNQLATMGTIPAAQHR